MKNKILAAFTACAVIMSFSGCGENMENISDMNSMTQSTNSDTDSSAFESSTSDLTGIDSETSNTDKQEQPKKIPMTDEELDKMFIGPYAINFFKQYEQAGKEFDFTISIDNVELLTHILDRLTGIIEKDDADNYELISDPMWDWDTEYYYFKPETVEKLIQEYFLSSFKISSVDYTKLGCWDSEKKQFKVQLIHDGYIGARDRFFIT